MDKILLSICIPTYNRVSNLKTLLRYLKKNVTSNKIEIIVSNNASTDDTAVLIDQFECNNFIFKSYNQDCNLGGDGNMRFLISKAQGKYIWLLGDDDYISIETISILCAELEKYCPDLYMMSTVSYDLFRGVPSKRTKKNQCFCNKLITIDDNTRQKLFCEDLSGMMFMSRLVYKSNILKKIHTKRIFDYASTLYWSGGALIDGNTLYYSSKAIILTDSNQSISWSDVRYRVLYEIIPEILTAFKDFGWNDKDIKKVLNYHIAYLFPNLIREGNKDRYMYLNFKVLVYFFIILKNYMLAKFKNPTLVDINTYSIRRDESE